VALARANRDDLATYKAPPRGLRVAGTVAGEKIVAQRAKVRISAVSAADSHSRPAQKGIDDRQLAEAAGVLEVFTVERIAARLDRGGEDQRVVKGQRMIAREHDRCGVGGGCDWDDIVEPIANNPKRRRNRRRRAYEPAGSGKKLVKFDANFVY
jgi:hypothetical protein